MMNPSATMSPMISSDGSERISLNSRVELGLPLLCVKTTIYPLFPACQMHNQGLSARRKYGNWDTDKSLKRIGQPQKGGRG